jgi:hypothetical protein
MLCGIIFFAACGKDGEAGPAGAKGDTGATGPAGTPGKDATSGIIYSEWLDVTFDAYRESEDGNGNGVLDTVYFGAQIDAPKITDEILSTGDVRVFINTYSDTEKDIAPLPFLNPISGATISPSFSTGLITLIANGAFNTVVDGTSKYQQYRYVIVPGGAEARKAAGIDWNNYEQVKAYLHLKD